MAKSIRLNDETKGLLDAYMSRQMEATGETVTADGVVASLLAIAERHASEESLTQYETEGIAQVRRMLVRVGDEMVSVLLHDKHDYELSLEDATKAHDELTQTVEALTSERDALVERVSELEPLIAEVESLRAKVAEADETKANTEQMLHDLQAQKEEMFERLTALMDETRSAREAADRERERNEALQSKLDLLIEQLSKIETSDTKE